MVIVYGRRYLLRTTAAGLMLWAMAAFGQFEPTDKPVVNLSTVWSQSGVKAGGQITLAVILDIRTPYHIQAHDAKEPFIPTKVEIVSAPEELRSSTPVFPDPQTFEFGPEGQKEKIQGFSGRTVIFIPMAVTGSAK